MLEIKLKSCPFCGSEAIIHTIEPHKHKHATWMPDYEGGTFIECSKCTCGMSGETAEEVITAWNTRKPVEKVVERIEAFKELFQDENCNSRIEQYCKPNRGRCKEWDCFSCVFEHVIEIVKEEVG